MSLSLVLLFLAAVGAEDVGGFVGEETTSDESSLALPALEAAEVPLTTVERDELRIVDTCRFTDTTGVNDRIRLNQYDCQYSTGQFI